MNYLNTLKERAKAMSALADLDTQKSGGIFHTLLQWLAFVQKDAEQMYSAHVADVERLLAKGRIFSLDWWHAKMLAFQYGDDLFFSNGQIAYEKIDAEKRIITRCAVLESSVGGITLKVVKGGIGALLPLNLEEQEALKVYCAKIKPAGLKIETVSLDAEPLVLQMKVHVDKMLIAHDGTSIAEGSKVVENGVRQFLQDVGFDGTVYLSQLTAYLQEIIGVRAVYIYRAQGGSSFFADNYNPKSGHLFFDLSKSVINYV
jgi:hypothetical protein